MTDSLVGTRLAHYQVSALIGRGGMGEVWRATDTRLDREVALKLLPEEVAANPERLERFQREARAVAALNHPNIVTIHSVEEAGDRHLLTMELIAGRSLDQLLPADGLDLDTLLSLGQQIAAALGAAHDHGITHRDLKPANVMVTDDGRVKLLDFGLAKLVTGEADEAETELLTSDGTILGTTPYMSPEQARGQAADPRSDVFSLGILLYEMATGRRPFTGESLVEVTSAILRDQPPSVTAVKTSLPNHLGRIVRRCLHKSPERRYASGGAVELELEELREESAVRRAEAMGIAPSPEPVPARTREVRWTRLVPWLVAGLALTVAGALAWSTLLPGPDPKPIFSRLLPPEGHSFSSGVGAPALSPDSTRVAFVAAAPDSSRRLFLQSLDRVEAEPLEGTDGASLPFWSPDGRSLGFFADGKLKRIQLPGGRPQELASAPNPGGGSWSGTGTILFVGDVESPPMTVHVDQEDGATIRLPGPYDGSAGDWFFHPWLLPDGRRFLLQLQDLDGERSGITFASLDAPSEARQLARSLSNTVYVEPGRLLHWQDGALVVRSFDLGSLEVDRGTRRLVEGVAWDQYLASGSFSVSGNVLVYRPGPGAVGDTELVRVDRRGRELSIVGQRAEYYTPRLSGDDTRVAVDITDIHTTHGDLWVLEIETGRPTLISRETINESSPVWLPGDEEVIFQRGPDLYRGDAAGASPATPALVDDIYKEPEDISPDGRHLLYTGDDTDLWVLDLESGETRRWLGGAGTVQSNGDFSPNGRWIAYQAEVAGTMQIQVRSFPDADEVKIDVSSVGGEHPAWRGDGGELYYYSPATAEIVAVAVEWVDGRPRFGAPQALFQAPVRDGFDVFRDGQGFVINRKISQSETEPLVLVQNWASLLR